MRLSELEMFLGKKNPLSGRSSTSRFDTLEYVWKAAFILWQGISRKVLFSKENEMFKTVFFIYSAASFLFDLGKFILN